MSHSFFSPENVLSQIDLRKLNSKQLCGQGVNEFKLPIPSLQLVSELLHCIFFFPKLMLSVFYYLKINVSSWKGLIKCGITSELIWAILQYQM